MSNISANKKIRQSIRPDKELQGLGGIYLT